MTAKKLLNDIVKKFKKANVDEADAEWIITEVCDVSRSAIGGQEVTQKQQKQINRIVSKRLKHIPLAQILHNRNFFGLDLYINKNVLIPRFETEGLCELVAKTLPKDVLGETTGLDLGTGSGAISVVLSHIYGYQMTAVDISRKALRVAKKNAKKYDCDITFVRSNMTDKLIGRRFDFVVANPPYILSRDLKGLSVEVVKHEPHLALDGGGDGLQFYRKIVADAPYVLEGDGYLFFEIGKNLEDEVMRLMKRDFYAISVAKDLDGVNRYVFGKLKAKRNKK